MGSPGFDRQLDGRKREIITITNKVIQLNAPVALSAAA